MTRKLFALGLPLAAALALLAPALADDKKDDKKPDTKEGWVQLFGPTTADRSFRNDI